MVGDAARVVSPGSEMGVKIAIDGALLFKDHGCHRKINDERVLGKDAEQ